MAEHARDSRSELLSRQGLICVVDVKHAECLTASCILPYPLFVAADLISVGGPKERSSRLWPSNINAWMCSWLGDGEVVLHKEP